MSRFTTSTPRPTLGTGPNNKSTIKCRWFYLQEILLYNNQIIISNKANYLVENTNYHHNHLKKICNKYLKPPNNTVCLVKQRGPSSSAYWIFNWAPLSPKAPQAAKAAGAQDFWG